jgi:hypothetical protein
MFRHHNFCSYRYRTDRILDSLTVQQLKKTFLYKDDKGYIPCTSTLEAMDWDTPCTSILLVMESIHPVTPHVHTAQLAPYFRRYAPLQRRICLLFDLEVPQWSVLPLILLLLLLLQSCCSFLVLLLSGELAT